MLVAGPILPVSADDAATRIQIEAVFWQSIEDSAVAQDFKAYLKEYPNGVFSDLALNRLAVLDPAAPPPDGNGVPVSLAVMDQASLNTVDLVFWDSIKKSKDPKDYDAYLRTFPEGIFRELAKSRLVDLYLGR